MSDKEKQNERAVPFFARFLEGQHIAEMSEEESEAIGGGRDIAMTLKYPSDWEDDGIGVTEKFPSDAEDDDDGGPGLGGRRRRLRQLLRRRRRRRMRDGNEE